MNILSLFDGISGGQIALDRLGIKVDNYFASEIDKHAISVTQKNFPSTIQLGSVTEVKASDLPQIDLLIGGSPCQGFSFAGKQLNFNDPRSKLFFEYVRILKETKPKYFLLENVKMKKEYQDIISEYLGVEHILLNSNLISAQNRKRLYWVGKRIEGAYIKPNITQPNDKGIMLKDIVHEYNENDNVDLTEYIVPFDKTFKILDKEVQRGKVGYFRKDSQANRVYYIHDKAITLCGEAGGGAAKMGQYLFSHTKKNGQGDRIYQENEKSPTINASSGGTAGRGNLLFGCLTPDRTEQRQCGQRFNDGKKFYTLTAQDRHGILTDGYIRKLTPIEAERLQTLDDGYTKFGRNVNGELVNISNPQRYKMIGNGWTIDIIAHILKNII